MSAGFIFICLVAFIIILVYMLGSPFAIKRGGICKRCHHELVSYNEHFCSECKDLIENHWYYDRYLTKEKLLEKNKKVPLFIKEKMMLKSLGY